MQRLEYCQHYKYPKMAVAKKSQTLSPIDRCQSEIVEIELTLRRLDLEDAANATGVDLPPAPDGSLFSQIAQSVDRARAEASAEEAAKLRTELRAQAERLLGEKRAELQRLQSDRSLAELRAAAATEEQTIMQLCQKYNDAAAQLYELGQAIKSAPRGHIVRLANVEGDAAIVLGDCPKLSITGTIRRLQFVEA